MIKNYTVNNKHLAINVGSGELPVLSTASLLGFIENFCMEKIKNSLDEKLTTVGVKVNLKHFKPSIESDEVECFIKSMSNQDNKKWIFEVEVMSNDKLVAICEHTRYVVNKEEFMEKTIDKE